MKQPHSKYFTASLAAAATGLSATACQAAVLTTTHNQTLDYLDVPDGDPEPMLEFDINADSVSDYALLFSDNDARKPQITTSNFNGGGVNQIFLTDSDINVSTLPVFGAGDTISTPGLDLLEEAFFYLNYEQNHYGDWGGAGGGPAAVTGDDAMPSAPPTGPVDGYVGLALPAMGGGVNYGYAHLSVDVSNSASGVASITLLDSAFETEVNTPLVGAVTVTGVPEPSALAALIAGAAGVAATRRRRACC